jgi:hypothetical protein
LLDAAGFLRHIAGMSSDEREIFNYVQTWGGEFINAKEVSRRAGTKQRFHEDPDWAKPIMLGMVERGILESDLNGRFRIKPAPRKGHKQRWVSPDIEKILNENGVEVEGAEGGPASDDHYDQL